MRPALFTLTCLLFSCFAVSAFAGTDTLTILNSGKDCSIRGMSIPANNVIWISGSNGHVARSTDAGKKWKWAVVNGFEKTDFRDIHAFDSSTAIIMGIGNPAYILKTQDGGQSWRTVFTKEMNGMFLDAMDFKNKSEGICIGDPIDDGEGGKMFFVIRTKDGGETWKQESSIIAAQEGEAIFSASGTNIALLDSKDLDYAFVSGGLVSNFIRIGRDGKPSETGTISINRGKETTGAFSMATDRKKKFYFVGGDYKEPDEVHMNFIWTTNGGRNRKTPDGSPPSGYRSCIQIIDRKRLVACGSNGVDICNDPNNWTRVSNEGFNVCMVTPNKKAIFLGGAKGKTAVIRLR